MYIAKFKFLSLLCYILFPRVILKYNMLMQLQNYLIIIIYRVITIKYVKIKILKIQLHTNNVQWLKC